MLVLIKTYTEIEVAEFTLCINTMKGAADGVNLLGIFPPTGSAGRLRLLSLSMQTDRAVHTGKLQDPFCFQYPMMIIQMFILNRILFKPVIIIRVIIKRN
jgi:hypothetical protein